MQGRACIHDVGNGVGQPEFHRGFDRTVEFDDVDVDACLGGGFLDKARERRRYPLAVQVRQ